MERVADLTSEVVFEADNIEQERIDFLTSEFLRDHMHKYIQNQLSNVQWQTGGQANEEADESEIRAAIIRSFQRAEKEIEKKLKYFTRELELGSSEKMRAVANNFIKMGISTALIVLIVQDMCFIANIGDSRAILSANQGHSMI